MTTGLQVAPLKQIYYELKDKMIDEEDILSVNVTSTYWQNIDYKLQNRGLNNIAIRGEVTDGKSTVAWTNLNYLINKLHNNPKNFNWNEHCFLDQTEFTRFTNSGQHHTAVMVDEYSRAAEIGINSSTEETMLDYYSDVFAQKYVHRVACAPSKIQDNNANVVLDVLGRDEEQQITRCKVLYRDTVEHNLQPLGYVDFYVGDIIRQPYYQTYRDKKFKRMELLDKQGVRDIRELEFAIIGLKTYEKLKPLAKMGKCSQQVILMTAQEVARKQKMWYSLTAFSDIVNRASGLIGLEQEHAKAQKQLEKENEKDDEDRDLTKVQALMYSTKQIKELLNETIKNETRLTEVYKEYINIQK